MKKSLLLVGAVCLFANQANAEYFFKPYVGLDYAHSWYDIDENKVELDDGSTLKLFKEHVNAGILSLGAKFHSNFSAEAFYMQTGKAKESWAESWAVYAGKTSVKYKAFGVDLIGSSPVYQDKLEFLGSLGAGYYKINAKMNMNVNGISSSESDSSNKWGLRMGVGAQYNITDHVAARVMLRNSRVDSCGSFNDVTAGVRVYF